MAGSSYATERACERRPEPYDHRSDGPEEYATLQEGEHEMPPQDAPPPPRPPLPSAAYVQKAREQVGQAGIA